MDTCVLMAYMKVSVADAPTAKDVFNFVKLKYDLFCGRRIGANICERIVVEPLRNKPDWEVHFFWTELNA